MKLIQINTPFPLKALWWNLYEWKDAEVNVDIKINWIYIIEVSAIAKNWKQNWNWDDDDLRMILDWYEFWKKETHEDKISWKWFWVSASWNWSTLKWSMKTVYFIVHLNKWKHVIEFIADNTPEIKDLKLSRLNQKENNVVEDIIFPFNEVAEWVHTDKYWIAWKAFVFQSKFNSNPFKVKLIDITATCKSWKQKWSTDWDNVKVYSNWKIVTNPVSPLSKKYRNFYFSWDISKWITESLMIPWDMFLHSESWDFSVELWYDQAPLLNNIHIEIDSWSKHKLSSMMAKAKEWLNLPKKIYRLNKIFDIKDAAWNKTLSYAKKDSWLADENKPLTMDNKYDAFRHFVWNVLMTREFWAENTVIIATNHEIFWRDAKNKKDLTRSWYIDLWNNKKWREYAEDNPKINAEEELFELALNSHDLITSLEWVTQKVKDEIDQDLSDYLWKK